MNNKLSILLLGILTSASALFGGKITIYNETPHVVRVSFSTYSNNQIPGTFKWSKTYENNKTLLIEPKSEKTYEAVATTGYLGNIPIKSNYGLDRFNFTSSSSFIVKGAVGETFSDYSKIDVPESGTWQLWIKSA